MKPVFAVGLLLLGFVFVYLAFQGKTPSLTQGATGGEGPIQNAQKTTFSGSNPLGLPTVQHLHDVNGSQGGFQ